MSLRALVKRLLVEEGLDIKRELYLSLLVDRESARVIFMASAAGGMDIEEVAKENPEAILREMIQPVVGLQPTPSGAGYWIAESNGAIAHYGDAPSAATRSSSTRLGT